MDDDSGAGPSTLPEYSILDNETTPVLNDNNPVQCDAMFDDEPALNDDPEDPMSEDLVLEEEMKPVKEVEWEEWLPTFYSVYEEPSFLLPDLSVETVFRLCEDMSPKDQARFLLS